MTNNIDTLTAQFNEANQQATLAVADYIKALRSLAADLESKLNSKKYIAIGNKINASTKEMERIARFCCVKIADRELAASLLSK